MKYQVLVRPEAENDLKGAFLWYEDKRLGLGYDFLLQVEASLRLVARNPQINPAEYKGARKHLTKRFPYKIIYLIAKERVIVLAIIHSKRSPGLIKNRIDGV